MRSGPSVLPEQKIVKGPFNNHIDFTLSTQLTLFSYLSKDLMNLFLIHFLKGTNSFNLLRASKNLYLSFNPTLWQLVDHPLRKLLSHGALGELEQAKAYYIQNNSILTFYGTVYHPNRVYNDMVNPPVWVTIPEEMSFGRYKYVGVTYLQILMMNDEWQEATEVTKYMDVNEVTKQFYEVFPDGKIVKYDHEGNEWNLEKANELLVALFNATIKDKTINTSNLNQMNDETRKAWKVFFNYHKPNPKGHSKGLVSDPRIVEAAFDLYESKYFEFFNNAQRSFWNIRVEQGLISLLGTGFLRRCSQGIFKIYLEPQGCLLADGSSYFAFRRSSDSLLPGYHFWVSGCGDQLTRRRDPIVMWLNDFQMYVKYACEQREILYNKMEVHQKYKL